MITSNFNSFNEQLPVIGSLLGLDIGKARIGIAVSDKTRMLASSREVYQRQSVVKDAAYINQFCGTNHITGIIAGWPLELDGTEGSSCKTVMQVLDALENVLDVPIFLQDERFSTAAVTAAMKDVGMKRKDRHAVDDQAAATYILQGVLDRI